MLWAATWDPHAKGRRETCGQQQWGIEVLSPDFYQEQNPASTVSEPGSRSALPEPGDDHSFVREWEPGDPGELHPDSWPSKTVCIVLSK